MGRVLFIFIPLPPPWDHIFERVFSEGPAHLCRWDPTALREPPWMRRRASGPFLAVQVPLGKAAVAKADGNATLKSVGA